MTTSRFRRYTSLSILLDILKKKRLTLLDPQNWDDKNDAFYMELYKTKGEYPLTPRMPARWSLKK